MVFQLNHVIANCERRGQGDGKIDESEGEDGEGPEHVFGSFKNHSCCALDQQKSFMQQHQAYLLKLWHMLDKHDLLGSSMKWLNKHFASGNGGNDVPSVINAMDEFSNKYMNEKM